MTSENTVLKIKSPFKVTMPINKHNLEIMIECLKSMANSTNFLNPKINETLLSLYYMSKKLSTLNNKDVTKCKLFPVKQNKDYPELLERYCHTSVYDPLNGTLYNREIRHLLLNGANIAEIDITATAVYIFAKYISKDDSLLQWYRDHDFYTLFPNLPRAAQKLLVQKWLQGTYKDPDKLVAETVSDIDDIDVELPADSNVYVALYNMFFPVTGKYLKETAICKNREYVHNSGLFRDREVRLLDEMLKSNVTLISHLHDGYYINPCHKAKCETAIKSVWGDDVKYKITDYSKINMSDDDIRNALSNINWDKDRFYEDGTPKIDPDNVPDFILSHGIQTEYVYDPYAALTGYLRDENGDCVRDAEGNFIEAPKSYVVQKKCIELFKD